MPHARKKMMWDFYIVFLLVVICIVVPFRLAFHPDESVRWLIMYLIIDFNFLIDMFVTFFTAIEDSETQEINTDKKFIAKRYLSGWFFIDFISILPLDVLALDSSGGGADANIVLRFLKIGKLYKLIRLTRLAKIFKLLKSSNAVLSQMSNTMQMSASMERITVIGVFAIFFFHIASCMFVFLCEFDMEIWNSWRYQDPYSSYAEYQMYITAMYYVVTTMSTVGYGDISGGTTLERIFCIALMLTGVVSFNLISGSLAAMITNYDSS